MDIRLDEGFLFGMGAFETIAVEKGKPILLEKHIDWKRQLISCSWVPAVQEDFQKKKYFLILPVRIRR